MKTYIGDAGHMGRGVFANDDISENEVVLTCPSWTIPEDDIEHLERTRLCGQYFANPFNPGVLLVLGDISIINHSDDPNISITFPTEDMAVATAKRAIAAHEQLFIDYGPDYPLAEMLKAAE